MTIEEIVERRRAAARRIEDVLRDLEAETGCHVRHLSVMVVQERAGDGVTADRRRVALALEVPA